MEHSRTSNMGIYKTLLAIYSFALTFTFLYSHSSDVSANLTLERIGPTKTLKFQISDNKNHTTIIVSDPKHRGHSHNLSIFYKHTTDEIKIITNISGQSLYPSPVLEEKELRVEWEGPSTFLEKGGIIGFTNARERLLCKLIGGNNCKTRYIADVIDTMWTFCPIYAQNQEKANAYYILQDNFIGYMKSIGIRSVILEAIYPNQKYLRTTAGNEPWEIQLIIDDTFYYRENLLNVAARKATGWEYMLWIDAHQSFENTYWWEEAIWGLEHYAVVQLFQSLDHRDQFSNKTVPWLDLFSTQYAYMLNHPPNTFFDMKRGVWNGNAFGIRKDLYNELGYILDTCIAGCCDCAYNVAAFGHWEDWYLPTWPHYTNQFRPWLETAWKVFKGEVKAMRGHIVHYFHPFTFDWNAKLKAIDNPVYILENELYRDENFTLHLKNTSQLQSVFPKIK